MLTDEQIDQLIDAEFGQPLTPATRRRLRADVREFGDMVIFDAGTMPEDVEKLPGYTGAEPMRELPEIRVTPEMVIRARHLGWSGRQMMIECIKRAMPGASDIKFMGAVDRNNGHVRTNTLEGVGKYHGPAASPRPWPRLRNYSTTPTL